MGISAIFLLKCFYLMLPAYFANMAPVIAKKINFLAIPVDFNKKINNRPLFGKNKTKRGFVFGILSAIIVAYVQHELYENPYFGSISFIDYSNWLLFGFLMGFGALTGDLAKSFFKRGMGIKPGGRFIPFDQTDFVIGAFLFAEPVFRLGLKIFVSSLVLSFCLHIIVNHAAFYLKVRSEKW